MGAITQHDLVAFLAASHRNYGEWSNYETMAQNLRLNTPEGAGRWDAQLKTLLPPLLRKRLLEWSRCEVEGCRHLRLTPLGFDTLKAWGKFGCSSHGGKSVDCGKRKPRGFIPAYSHGARAA